MNKKSGRTTIYDVAEKAGVSPSTVSKALNDPDNTSITAATRTRVFNVAQELNYPKLKRISRDERDGKRVAVIIPNLMNPYYAPLVSGLEAVLHEADMLMVLYNSRNDPALEVRYANQIRGSSFAGVAVASICKSSGHIKRLINDGIKVLAFEQQVDLLCNRVYFDYEKGGYMAASHLARQGRKRIAFLCSPLTRPSRRQVLEGYKRALRDNNLRVERELVCIAPDELARPNELYEYQNGKELMNGLMDAKINVDAVFCINDITAIGAIHALGQRGVAIPESVAVIGFDNIFYSEMVSPRLTTIEQSGYELGSAAADLLIRSLKDNTRENVAITLEPRLIVRDSG